jgi:predicted metal-dependent hydrolase
MAPAAKFEQAVEAFNRGRYLEAAETFENVTAEAGDDLKPLAAALNGVATALHMRFRRGGRQATVNLLSQAMLALEEMRPERAGVDVAILFDEIAAYTEAVRATPRDERDGVRHRARLFVERRRAPKIKPKR